jgi:RTX calcium-binding nonapeptide repeat (4 copies)
MVWVVRLIVDLVFEHAICSKVLVDNNNQIFRRVSVMRKFIFSLIFFGSFAFLYFATFSPHAHAFTLTEPCKFVCKAVCDDPSSIKCQDGGGECLGTDEDDVICGSDHGDIVEGGLGDDIICGGDGHDTIYGDDGDDGICAGDGNDIIYGGSGNDTLIGFDGNDTIFGDSGDDNIIGGDGNDYCQGGTGDNSIDGCEDGDG